MNTPAQDHINLKDGKGEWAVQSFDKVSPEMLLTYLAKMSIFYTRTEGTNKTPPISRDIKNLLLEIG